MKYLLSSTAFLVLNKELARKVGLNAAVLLADLISKEEYFIANGMTDDWFFNTENNIEKDTTLTPYQQRKCIQLLKQEGLIEIKRKGIPAKQYFKINIELVVNILENLSFNKLTTINKNKEIKIINKYFKKPKQIEIKVYCIERNNNIDYEAFWDFYESKDWFVGKSKMKDWKAAVRNWERNNKNKSTTSKLDAQISQYEQAKKLL
jgi:hypothetical protein